MNSRTWRKLWFKVSGMHTPERQELAKRHATGQVWCKPEAPGVFRVETESKQVLGYMPSDLAAQIAPVVGSLPICGRIMMRDGGHNWAFESHYKHNVPYGLLVEIIVPDYVDSAGDSSCLTPNAE